jgi:hypothetical protein
VVFGRKIPNTFNEIKHMKKSELKRIITEIINESIDSIKVSGVIFSTGDRNFQDILSNIRSLPGITTIDNQEMPQSSNSKYFRSRLNIKIDPYYLNIDDDFERLEGEEEIKQYIIDAIKKVDDVVGFKESPLLDEK